MNIGKKEDSTEKVVKFIRNADGAVIGAEITEH